MTNDIVAKALAALSAAHPEVVAQPSSASREESPWLRAPPIDKTELHQKLTAELDSTVVALIACEAAVSNWDDERQWDQLAGAISAVVRDWPAVGLDLVDAVGFGHAAVDVAVVRGWTMSQPDAVVAPRIIRRISLLELEPILSTVTAMLGGFGYGGTTPVEWFKLSECEDLARKCWETTAQKAVGTISSADDYAMMATNHPAGHLAEFWVERIGNLWRATPEGWTGIPAEMADYLSELLLEADERNEAVRIIFCRYLHFLYRADDEWCRQYLMPLFNWENAARASKAWSGFLSHGGWTNKLIHDGFLKILISTVDHRDKLDRPGQRNLPRLLAAIAVAAEADTRSWIRDLTTKGTIRDRVDWARAIRFQLASLSPEAVEAQWSRWMRDYMTDRVKSVPRKLEPAEASAMAGWILFLGDSMASAIELLLQMDTVGLEMHDLFFHDLSEAQIAREPQKIAQLVHHLLKSTTGQFFGAHEIRRAYEQFKSRGVSTATLAAIAESAMHLGIPID